MGGLKPIHVHILLHFFFFLPVLWSPATLLAHRPSAYDAGCASSAADIGVSRYIGTAIVVIDQGYKCDSLKIRFISVNTQVDGWSGKIFSVLAAAA